MSYKYGEKLRSLEFSLTMGCSLNCNYCPQSLLLEKYYKENTNRKRYLGLEEFKMALAQVDEGGTISICGMSEPFSNPNCTDMILYAYEKGYSICINTTLVGAKAEDINRIKDVKFESFVLHIPDEENHSKFHVDNNYLELLDLLHETQRIDFYSCHGTVHNMVFSHLNKEVEAGISLGDRAGNLDIEDIQPVHKAGKLFCLHGNEKKSGIWAPVMLPDGTLVLCCNDYGMKHVLGNLFENTWAEIKQGQAYLSYRHSMETEGSDVLCRSCVAAKNVEELPAVRINKMLQSGDNGEIIRKLREADEVCVYGLGKYFRDHYFDEYWHELFKANYFSDRNEELWGKQINGIECCSPNEIDKNALVVVFALRTEEIIASLHQSGIRNVITICELLETLGR